jgi:hypothetical protein
MEKRIARCITLIALIGLVLTLGFISVPVLACVPNNKATAIVVKADLWNDELQLPLSIEICASGSNHLLIGVGTTNDPACGKSIIMVTGCINGHSLTLTGQIVKGLDTPQLKGTKIKLEADLQTGNMILTLGPISPGLPLSGLTFVFTGNGLVSLKL